MSQDINNDTNQHSSSSFLEAIPESAFMAGGGSGWEAPEAQDVNHLFEEYELVSTLGRGGMGVVYRARQHKLKRDVAIKVLPPGHSQHEEFGGRFQREAQILAGLQHNNIVQIYDYGQTSDGDFYYVMELVEGQSLHEMLSEDWSIERLVDVSGQVCDALQYAHEKGIVHRDIKPANILVRNDGVVKVMDFGLAKPQGVDADLTQVTLTGLVMGTFDYMAPEQKEGKTDPRSDIFALGVICYQLLMKKLPQGVFEAPSKRYPEGKNVDNLINAALANNPDERIQSAAHFKQISSELVNAVPKVKQVTAKCSSCKEKYSIKVSQLGQYARCVKCETKFELKKAGGGKFIAMITVVALLVSIMGIYGYQWNRKQGADKQDKVVVEELGRNDKKASDEVDEKSSDIEIHEKSQNGQKLAQDIEKNATEKKKLKLAQNSKKQIPELGAISANGDPKSQKELRKIVFPQGVGEEKSVDLKKGKEWLKRAHSAELKGDHYAAAMMAGKSIGYYGFGRKRKSEEHPIFISPKEHPGDFKIAHDFVKSSLKKSAIPIWTSPVRFSTKGGVINSLCVVPKRGWIVVGYYSGLICIWSIDSGELLYEIKAHRDCVSSVACSPNGRVLATGSFDKTIRLWDLSSGKQIGRPFPAQGGWIDDLCFSPNGRVLASASKQKIQLWDVRKQIELGKPIEGHSKRIDSICFHPDGKLLVSSSWDGKLKIWDVKEGKQVGQLFNKKTQLRKTQFSSDGKMLITGSGQGLLMWDAKRKRVVNDRIKYGNPFCISHDGKVIAAASHLGIQFGNLETGEEAYDPIRVEGNVLKLEFSIDNNKVIIADYGGITVFDVKNKRVMGDDKSGHIHIVSNLSFSPDGKRLVSTARYSDLALWDLEKGERMPIVKNRNLRELSGFYCKDGTLISFNAASRSSLGRRVDLITGQEAFRALQGPRTQIRCHCYSPDGKVIAFGLYDKTISLWNTETGEQIGKSLLGHSKSVSCIQFSPDGKYLASGSTDETVCLWDVQKGEQVRSPMRGHKKEVSSLSFSPDGNMLASGSRDNTVVMWDLTTGNELNRYKKKGAWRATSVSICPNGEEIAVGYDRGGVVFFNVSTGEEQKQYVDIGQRVEVVRYSPNGSILAIGAGNLVKLVNVKPTPIVDLMSYLERDVYTLNIEGLFKNKINDNLYKDQRTPFLNTPVDGVHVAKVERVKQSEQSAAVRRAGTRKVVEIAPGVKLGFRWCPPTGKAGFQMGGARGHKVQLTKGFWMAETECTYDTWKKVMQKDTRQKDKTRHTPVSYVSWNDAHNFVKKLNSVGGLSKDLQADIPSEAEWEYACRAGSEGDYHFGNDESELCKYGNYRDNSFDRSVSSSDGFTYAAPVASYKPNQWGLYDMHGNVYEWVKDSGGELPIKGEVTIDPLNNSEAKSKVLRGGSWWGTSINAKSHMRNFNVATSKTPHYGFRIILRDKG